jgi:transposase
LSRPWGRRHARRAVETFRVKITEVLGTGPGDLIGVAIRRRRVSEVCVSLREEMGQSHGAIERVARQLGCGAESLRLWVKQSEVDGGERPGTTTSDAEQIKTLEQENRELRRANDILRRASAFFAAELDGPPR